MLSEACGDSVSESFDTRRPAMQPEDMLDVKRVFLAKGKGSSPDLQPVIVATIL